MIYKTIWFRITGLLSVMLTATTLIAAPPIRVTVSIPPQAYVVEQVAGKLAEVAILLPDGKSPHDYAPSPSQIIALAAGKVYFTIGLPFEKTIVDKMRGQTAGTFVNMAEGIVRIPAETDAHHHHESNGSHHHHEGDDPHVWTAPLNLAQMALNTAATLQRLDPANAAVYESNGKRFAAEMAAMDRSLAAELAPYKGRIIYVYHPAFGYFMARYGLKQEAIEEQGKDPTPKQLIKLIAAAKKDGVKVIIVQKQFNSRSAETIARAIGGKVLPVDNLQRNAVVLIRDIAAAVCEEMRKK